MSEASFDRDSSSGIIWKSFSAIGLRSFSSIVLLQKRFVEIWIGLWGFLIFSTGNRYVLRYSNNISYKRNLLTLEKGMGHRESMTSALLIRERHPTLNYVNSIMIPATNSRLRVK